MFRQLTNGKEESSEKVLEAKVTENRKSNVFETSNVKTNRLWKRDQEKQLKPKQSSNMSIHFESYETFH